MRSEQTAYEDWIQLLALANTGDNIAQYEVAVHYDGGLVVNGIKIVDENQPMAFNGTIALMKMGMLMQVSVLPIF